jgi:Fe-S-cluster containining protein
MVAKHSTTNLFLDTVAEIYDWLDLQIRKFPDSAGTCKACGRCCDFAQFDHHLFVTTPELVYFVSKLGGGNIRPLTTSRCPYNIRGKCTVYEHRFAACRIFSCEGDADFQSGLSEAAVKKFKSLCEDFRVSYRYSDLARALNDAAANICQSAAGCYREDRKD